MQRQYHAKCKKRGFSKLVAIILSTALFCNQAAFATDPQSQSGNSPASEDYLGTIGRILLLFGGTIVVSAGVAYTIKATGDRFKDSRQESNFSYTWMGSGLGLLTGLLIAGQSIPKAAEDKIPEYIGLGLGIAYLGGVAAYYLSLRTLAPETANNVQIRVQGSANSPSLSILYSTRF